MMIGNQIFYAVIHNIAISIFIIVLCFAFVGLVIVLDWLLTFVIEGVRVFLDRNSHHKENRNGQL
jgi:hypothetical protein